METSANETSAEEFSEIQNISADVFFYGVFPFMPVKGILKLSTANKRFYEKCWLALGNCGKAKLKLSANHIDNPSLFSRLRNFLVRIVRNFLGGSDNGSNVKQLKENFIDFTKRLKYITLTIESKTDMSVDLSKLKNLVALEIFACDKSKIKFKRPLSQVKRLKITDHNNLTDFQFNNFTNLEELRLVRCKSLTDEKLEEIRKTIKKFVLIDVKCGVKLNLQSFRQLKAITFRDAYGDIEIFNTIPYTIEYIFITGLNLKGLDFRKYKNLKRFKGYNTDLSNESLEYLKEKGLFEPLNY
jgi:hypothetical protein